MTKSEVENLSKWTMRLWKTYMKYLRLELEARDFDVILEEMKAIYEENDHDPLIMDMCTAFANELDRRNANA